MKQLATISGPLVVLAVLLLTSSALAQSCCDPFDEWMCQQDGGRFNQITCECRNTTPIIISLSTASDLRLTSVADGVLFDIDADGTDERIAWTASGANVGFLVLDRNHNGEIDDGRELFSDVAPQPRTHFPNGFLALAEFDKLTNGGNANGFIDSGDSIYDSLRIWIDRDHNAMARADELRALRDAGVFEISLDYKEVGRRDEYGNRYRYRSRINSLNPHDGERNSWAWDVLLKYQLVSQVSSISDIWKSSGQSRNSFLALQESGSDVRNRGTELIDTF